ncbi:glycosyltransferase [Streptomyces lunaelactis]|uniref:glycosyltransferase n=1 Tax=Streptomyces lunaelactis TaxID=1535768 RepID=UPI0015850FDF|nr:glycosyltransferase [Streptomyces lunaelactis]NUK02056.1 glycosyltransferase [Streptomyces lunaelactis]NUK15979.1 glycosyltransferase [Streptomyces lunaelactis]NUK21362.1 glycosyltransferase [Streptomyces lunaelactis]
MTQVLLIAGHVPQPALLKASLEKFRAAGATVRLAGLFESADIDSDGLTLAGIRSLPEGAEAAHGEAFVRRISKGAAPRRVWRHVERDRWVRGHARKAQVLVALDAGAVYTVWRLSQRNRRADAVFGIAPALKAVADRQARPGHYALRDAFHTLPSAVIAARRTKRLARLGANGLYHRATSPTVMRNAVGAKVWRSAVSAPRLPDGVRARLAKRVSHSMAKGGRRAGSVIVLHSAAERVADRALQAELLVDAARRDIGRGHDDLKGRARAIKAALALADERYKKGDPKRAAELLSSALTLAFHRAIHFDGLSSPLMTDTAGYLAPFRDSTAFAALSAPRGREVPAATPPADRPMRLLVTTYSNANFLQPIMDRYAGHPGVEIRFLDLKEDDEIRPLARGGQRMMEHLLGGQRRFGTQVEHALRPHLDWADTVFVDWATNASAIFSLVDPGTTRMVVRLHSYEAFTFWPHLVDFTRVDDVVFVGDHLRDLTVDLLPRLSEPGAPELHVIANAMFLERFQLEKASPDARFTLGLVGVSAVAKDPRWALDVLRILRGHDERYRMVVVGDGLDRKASRAARDYDDLLQRDLDELTATGAVDLIGRTDDVPGALTNVGVILSSSVRESFHCGLVEGAASGALPVVRDWPFFADKANGARTLFPADWIVTTPEEAAERILALTGSEENWRTATASAAKHSLSTWDWSVVGLEFDRLLLSDEV